MMRDTWIDAAKGLGILAVVIGHVAANQDGAGWAWIAWAIWLFHMPLFFVLSGYLFRPGNLGATFRARARGLLLPYTSFLILLMVLSVALEWATRGPLSGAELGDLAKLAVLGGPYLTGTFGVFWFVTSLFVASLAYAALRGRGGPFAASTLVAVAAAVLLAYALQAWAPDLRLPWSLDTALVALACLWSGEAVRVVGLRDRRILVASMAVVVTCVLAGLAGVDFRFDMKAGEYGPPVLGLLLAWALSVLLARVALDLLAAGTAAKALAWVGAASLVVMFLHQFVHLTLRRADAPVLVILLLSVSVPLAAYLVLDRNEVLASLFLGRRRRAARSSPAVPPTAQA